MGNDGAISSLLMGFTQVHVREDSGLCTALSRSISIRMYLGFWAMYRGWKSIKPYDSVEPFTAYLPKCTCWCQSRVYVAHGLALLHAMRTWCVVREGRCREKPTV